MLSFWKFVSRRKPDIVFINQFALESFWLSDLVIAFLVSRGNGFMFVHDCIPLKEKYTRKMHANVVPTVGMCWLRRRIGKRLLACFCRNVIAVSEEVRQMLIVNYGYPQKKVKLIHYGVDTRRFSPAESSLKKNLRESMHIPLDAVIVASTARLDWVKRLERLIAAFSELAHKHANLWLLMAGTGPHEDRLRALVDKLDDASRCRVRFLGFVEDPVSLLQMSDIFVLPSQTEGLPIGLLEAMSCGLITVVTNSGGPSEAVKDKESGFLVEKSAEGVLHGLREALSLSPEQVNVMAQRARKTIEDRFEITANIKKSFDLIGVAGRFSK